MATMKVKVSNPMVKSIKEALDKKGIKYETVSIEKFSERGYVLNVAGTAGMYDAQDNGDYDWKNDEYKAIRVTYPYEFYAMPAYITTANLTKYFNACREKTLDALMDKVCDAIAI